MKKNALLTTSLLLAIPAMAGDWTPVLKGMQNGRNTELIEAVATKERVVPNNLKGDIVSHNNKNTGDGKIYTVSLKNATAFGYPITKIQYEQVKKSWETIVYFTVSDFKAILPSFYHKVENTVVRAGTQTAIRYQSAEN